MARNRIGLEVKGFEEYMEKLDKLGGTATMKRGVEAALKASKEYVNPLINANVANANLPAGGRYSTGTTKRSIDTDMSVSWQGMTGEIKVGFDFKESGMASIFLMYGTPKMSPVAGLKDTIYGSKTKREIKKIQAEALDKVIKRTMEG